MILLFWKSRCKSEYSQIIFWTFTGYTVNIHILPNNVTFFIWRSMLINTILSFTDVSWICTGLFCIFTGSIWIFTGFFWIFAGYIVNIHILHCKHSQVFLWTFTAYIVNIDRLILVFHKLFLNIHRLRLVIHMFSLNIHRFVLHIHRFILIISRK